MSGTIEATGTTDGPTTIYDVPVDQAHLVQVFAPDAKEVMRIEASGRIFWAGREVETDDDFRTAMLELRNAMLQGMSRRASVEQIARAAHEVNRAYCQALGDLSQPAWEEAPDWQRASAMEGVRLHLSGDHGPEASHANWMAQKEREGWVYGPTKDPAAKQHPCMVPFHLLPREQKAKDFIFRAVVHAFKENW